MSVTDKTFSSTELEELLLRAARHLVELCRTDYCDPPPPAEFIFFLAQNPGAHFPHGRLVDAHGAVAELRREDGHFRDWINLSPVAVAGDKTVLQLDFPERFTNRLLVGELAFRFEPFMLAGPALPSSWTDDQPVPKVALPRDEAG